MAHLNTSNMSPAGKQALEAMLRDVALMGQADPMAIERVATLFEQEPRMREFAGLLMSIIPPMIDGEQWLSWIDGGRAPSAAKDLADPEKSGHPSARGAQHAASSRYAETKRRVDDAEEELQAARVEMKKREQEAREASNQLRAAVFFRVFVDLGRSLGGPFAMGPMWTVARAVSAHLRRDVALEASLSDDERQRLEEHRSERRKTTPAILDLLDLYAGDVILEMKIHEGLHDILQEHHRPVLEELERRNIDKKPLSAAAKRTKRRSEERRTSVRPGAAISDRSEVLGGLQIRDPGHGAPRDPGDF